MYHDLTRPSRSVRFWLALGDIVSHPSPRRSYWASLCWQIGEAIDSVQARHAR